MQEPKIESKLSKGPVQLVLEYILLVVIVCVIALRTTFTEGPISRSNIGGIGAAESSYGLLLSVVLIIIFFIRYLWGLCSSRFLYRYTILEAGLIILVIGAFISGFGVADQRQALNNIINLVAPMLMAVVLVQILDSESKIRIFLTVIVSLGIVSVYQSAEQFFWTRPMLIQQYQRSSESLIGTLGIEQGSFQQMLFENWLYSRGVSSFFTTCNSAGSFTILIVFVIVGFFSGEYVNRKFNESAPARLCADVLVLTVAAVGLVLSFSKGSILAAGIAGLSFAGYVLFREHLTRRKRVIVVITTLILVCGFCLVIISGVLESRLPGGNSLQVRRQYWSSSAGMYADNPYVGVGPGNFAHFYPRYKSASAIETVADPHNFIFSILTQYGPLGLAGFLAVLFLPLFRVMFSGDQDAAERGFSGTASRKAQQPERSITIRSIIFLVAVSGSLLILRPMLIRLPYTITESERLAAEVILFFMPVFVFIVSFLFMSMGRNKTGILNNRFVIAAFFFGICGFVLHNLTDFAIFEPGVATTFWAVTACLIALDNKSKGRSYSRGRRSFSEKLFSVSAGVIFIWCFLVSYALMPVNISTARVHRARSLAAAGSFESAYTVLQEASASDRINPELPLVTGKFCLQQSSRADADRTKWLGRAEKSFAEAIKRNPADYRNYEKLSDTYRYLANRGDEDETVYLQMAFSEAITAVEHYPNCGRLHFKLAAIALELGKKDFAAKHYLRSVRIEDAYRKQFRLMYPKSELVSRLGEQRYNKAKRQIEKLSQGEDTQG